MYGSYIVVWFSKWYRWSLFKFFSATRSHSSSIFSLQVQVDSQTSHLANRSVDFCQVQIWPSTFTLRGHPESHAGSWLGGKSAFSLSCSLWLECKLSQKNWLFWDWNGPLVKVHSQLHRHSSLFNSMQPRRLCCQLSIHKAKHCYLGIVVRFCHLISQHTIEVICLE